MVQRRGTRLASIRLLESLSDEERSRLEQACRWHQFRPGEQILDRDSADRDVLFVTQGKVRIVNYSATGREVAFAIVESGGHVGELSALDGQNRSASVVAVSPCTVALLPPERFRRLLAEHVGVATDLLCHLARIIRIGNERIAELSTVGAVQRVYRELLRLAQPDPSGKAVLAVSPLPTQHDLASQVGATRETVARALGQLVHAGVVERHGRTLLILEHETLIDLADPEAGMVPA